MSYISLLSIAAGFGILLAAKSYFGKKTKEKASFKITTLKTLIKTLGIYLIAFGAVEPYLMQRPEVLQKMVVKMQENLQKDQKKKVNNYIKENKKEMEENAPILGNENGKTTMYVFFDYTCSACKMGEREIEKLIESDKEIKVVLKNYPIRNFSFMASQAAIAAKMQSNEKGIKFHTSMMNGNIMPVGFSQSWDEKKVESEFKKTIFGYAKAAGLNISKLEEDMKSDTVMKELQQSRLAGNEFGLEGTPFIVIGENFFPGAQNFEALQEAVKQSK